MNIPDNIKRFIGNKSFEVDTVGMSDSKVICFHDMVLKIENQCEESEKESKMMQWLADKLPVPKVICSEKLNNKNYLLMSKVRGSMSCGSEFLRKPELLVKVLVEGLKMLWAVDISDCPCDSSIVNKLKLAQERVLSNLCSMDNVEQDTYGENGFSSPQELLKWLKDNKPNESYVLSHGDYCLPNIFIDNNKISGFIDLGRCGIGDKYQDIALCYRSLVHNFEGRYGGEVYEGFNADILFHELGIEPNWDKIRYYILLDELF